MEGVQGRPMDSPKSESLNGSGGSRASIIKSFGGCTLCPDRIRKEDLRKKITIPEYLRLAMKTAISSKDVDAGKNYYEMARVDGGDLVEVPESPLVVFINSRSGGRHGPELKMRLQDLMGEEQVFDLSLVKPNDFVQYGLGCLEKYAELGDSCAKVTREKLRVVVAGGDGTVGWVLGCLGVLHKQGREPVPPTGVIPLGTGNDLSRTFGWGGAFPFNWRKGVKKSLDRATNGLTCRLDSWNIFISMPAGKKLEIPHSLKQTNVSHLDEELEVDGEKPEKSAYYEGTFYNYFSIGMDAQVAYGFHNLRNEKPYLAQGPISNKIIYSGFSCTQGWFFTPCISDPGLRGLNNILRMYVKKVNCSEWEKVPIPSSVRSIVALNLPNYGSGRNPWGNLKPDYMQKKGFVEAHADDGLLEIFGLKQGWHASFVMVELISAKHIAQAAAIRFELRGGQWKKVYVQIDGEPWKQPIFEEYSTCVEIQRAPFQSVMINGE